MKKTLVIGIGNIARADDGIGWAFADKLVDDARFDVVHRYQLQVEDAELISRYACVWFVDASHSLHQGGFECKALKPVKRSSYTSHALHPSTVLYLCEDLYQCSPRARLLGITGEHWKLGHPMSTVAGERLERAFTHFLNTFDHGLVMGKEGANGNQPVT